MSIYVISDLHVSGADDPLYRKLIRLLRERPRAGDTFVLAGDLFDLFVGKKQVFLQRYSAFLEAVREAGERGVRVHYIEGNHDFLLRGVFGAFEGVTVHARQVEIEEAGRRFFIAHGDLVDREDYGYLLLRLFFRSPLMRAFVRFAPDSWVEGFGTGSARKSRRGKPVQDPRLPLEKRERLRRVYRNYAAERLAHGYDFVVLGHCHDLDEMGFSIGGRFGQYVNVGFPRVHGSFLSWSPGDEKLQREALPEG